MKNHDFTPKNHIFSNFRGARAWGRAPGCDPPGFAPDPSLLVHLVLAPVFGRVRVARVLLVLCVFSFISYVLLVVFVSVFIVSSLSLNS